MPKQKAIPAPETLSDAYLLHQMGYTTEVDDGQILTIKRGEKICLRKCLRSTPAKNLITHILKASVT